MTAQLESALALLFRRYRDPPVSEDDLVKGMSLTLTWTKPSSATHLLARGVHEGLLERGEDGYTPLFDPGDVDVPFGFDPPNELFEPIEPPVEDPAPTKAATEAEEPAKELDPVGLEEATEAWDDTPILEALVDRIAERVEGGNRRAAIAAVNAKQEALESLVTLPAAALIVARELGLDTAKEGQSLLEELRSSG